MRKNKKGRKRVKRRRRGPRISKVRRGEGEGRKTQE